MSKGYDTKIAAVIREDLPVWQKLNVTAFTVSGIVASAPDTIGEPYEDASGNTYLPMLNQPVIVYSADAEQIRTIYMRTREHKLKISLFTMELFATRRDQENYPAVRAVSEADLDIGGMAMRATNIIAANVLRGLTLHT